MELTLITVDANGLCSVDKRSVLVQWLRSLPTVPDVVCLQEYHCVSLEECQSWFRSSGFSSVVSLGSRWSCGCIVLFHNPLLLVNSWTDTDGRFLQCEFFCHNSIIRVACVYAPNRNPERMVSLLMFRPVLTRPSLPFCAVILMLFLIVALIVLALLLMTPRGRVPPPLLIFFPLVVLWTSGVSYSRLFPASLGPGAMVFVPVESILLVALFLGCRWFLLGHRSLSLLRSFCRFAFVLGSSGFPVGFWPLEAKCFCAGGA